MNMYFHFTNIAGLLFKITVTVNIYNLLIKLYLIFSHSRDSMLFHIDIPTRKNNGTVSLTIIVFKVVFKVCLK